MWSSISLGRHRSNHGACLLADGRVLVTGGGGRADYESTGACHFDEPRSHDSAEMVDPRTGRAEPTASLAIPREGHHALRLGDDVLLVGGLADYG